MARTLKIARYNAGTRFYASAYRNGHNGPLSVQASFRDQDGRQHVIDIDPSQLDLLIDQLNEARAVIRREQPELLTHRLLRSR